MTRTVRGRIVFVQEGRFMLRTESGTGQLLVLSHRAAVAPEQLPPLQHAQARVEIDCEVAPNGMSAIAYAVRVLDDAVAAKAEAV